jgi:hypothetical protein
MKVLVILTFMLGLFVAPAYAQQKGTVTFNGNVFDQPSAQGGGYAQAPGSTPSARGAGAGYAQSPGNAQPQPPARAKTYHHVRRHIPHKSTAS